MRPKLKELEKRLGAYDGVKHSIACSFGADALLIDLMAYGDVSGDAIFTRASLHPKATPIYYPIAMADDYFLSNCPRGLSCVTSQQ